MKLNMFKTRPLGLFKNRKGRLGWTEARSQLQLNTLKDRRKPHRNSLLMRILSDENKHQALPSAYDKIVNDRNKTQWLPEQQRKANQPLSMPHHMPTTVPQQLLHVRLASINQIS